MPEPITPVVKRIKDAAYYRDKLIRNVVAVGQENYRLGVASPKHNPILRGIAMEPRYRDEMKKVLAEERRKKMLGFTNMAYWGEMSGIFSDRLVPGVQNRTKKIDRFWTGWVPLLRPHVEMLDKEFVETFAQRKAKMIKNVDELKKKKAAWLKPLTGGTSPATPTA